MKRRSQWEVQKQVDEWNDRVEVGDTVVVQLDSGERLRTRTRSEADILGGHSPVVWLEGVAGCYALERVRPVEEVPC